MSARLTVVLDFKDPYSYLALAPTLALVDELAAEVRFAPFLTTPMQAPQPPGPDADRGTLHRWHRGRYRERELRRYAEGLGLAARRFGDGGLYRETRGEVAAIALLWARDRAPERLPAFLWRAFAGYWDADLDLDDPTAVAGALRALRIDADGFAACAAEDGPAALAAERDALIEAGCFATPTYMLDDEVFVGRQHLPLLRRRVGRP